MKILFWLGELQNVRKRQKGKQTSGGFAGKTSFPRLFIGEESRSQKVLAINRKSPLMAVMDRISFVSAVARIAYEWIKCCFLIIGLLISRSMSLSSYRHYGNSTKCNEVIVNFAKSVCLGFSDETSHTNRCTAAKMSNRNWWRDH